MHFNPKYEICAILADLMKDPYDKKQTSKDVKGDGSLVGAQFFRTGMEHFRRHYEVAGEIL